MKKLLLCLVPLAVMSLPADGSGQASRPDGVYAAIHTSKGRIVARLEADLTPMTVANFVGLAEGTLANDAFDPGRPYFDGTTWHRVVPGHVIQAGVPRSDRARGPGYAFPNEIHARLSHDHAGALNMANSGPGTNASQFCITLGDRSYLDGDYIVFGEVVEGLDVVMRIVQGDVIDSVRIVRTGEKAQSFRPDTESFRGLVRAAEARATEHVELKRQAEEDWIARNYPAATGPQDDLRTIRITAGSGVRGAAPLRVRYRGTIVRYVGHVLGHEGAPIRTTSFGSRTNGAPGFVDTPETFTFEPGTSTIHAGLDRVLAEMTPGERRVIIVPPALAYGRSGHYAPEAAGRPRLVVSPNTLLVYEVEVLSGPASR